MRMLDHLPHIVFYAVLVGLAVILFETLIDKLAKQPLRDHMGL